MCVILDFKLSCTENLFIVTAGQGKGFINFVLSVLFILSLLSINIPGTRMFVPYCVSSLASPLTGLLTK